MNEQQAWLARAASVIRDTLVPDAPENVLVSYGFPRTRDRAADQSTGGITYVKPTPDGIHAVVFINPKLWTDAPSVLGVLVHEMLHCAAPEAGHGAEFKRRMADVGLTGQATATVPGPWLTKFLADLAESLGPFPAAAFDPKFEKVKGQGQKGRLRRFVCTSCGLKVYSANDTLTLVCHGDSERYQQPHPPSTLLREDAKKEDA